MAEAYDYMKESGYAAAYLRLRGAAVRLAGRFGAGRLGEIAAGAPDVIYTLVMLLRDGRVPQKAKVKLGIAAAYFAMPLDVLPFGALDDVYVGLIALAGVMDDVGEGLLCEYWPGDIADLLRFKALMDSLNEKYGAGAVRRLASALLERK